MVLQQTQSIRACCFDAETGAVVGDSCASAYQTYHPQPGWAEQKPEDWWNNLGEAVRGAVSSISDDSDSNICGICVDTTCCSVVALDKDKEPLRPSLLWMDARSAAQTVEVMEKCKGDPALEVNSGGHGPLSAEWMTPKSLWIRQNEPEIWEKAETVCEYQDYINYKMTGKMVASSCNAAARWHWDGEECLKESTDEEPYPGRPISLYDKLGIPELASKLPKVCLPMGSLIGGLTEDAAKHLNLPVGLPVSQGGPDAFVGMIGLGCINPGQLCLITGSSHLHCVVSSLPHRSSGIWGAYRGAPLPGINFAEGGQSSTGSIIRWARKVLGAEDVDYATLDSEADKIPPGCEGLVALETFQGSRTPETDALARGALLGLSLSHTRAHIWRAFMEAVCYGTRGCIEGLEKAGHECEEIIVAGGATRSKLWLQMHADVTGKPVVVCENSEAPLLGSAILASYGVGVHGSVSDAVAAMVRTKKRVEPSPDLSLEYANLYDNVYSKVNQCVKPISHAIARLRGGDSSGTSESRKVAPTISPSLLACDFVNMKTEVLRCVEAGAPRLHVDIFDSVALDSPWAFTFGPQMVKALRACSSDAILDLHMCVYKPDRFVDAMKEAGADRFIFQFEAMANEAEVLDLAKRIMDAGMKCGISINPATSVASLDSILASGLVSVVNLLAVEPGFGGQQFNPVILQKIEHLLRIRQEKGYSFEIGIDGGINEKTAPQVSKADVLVAGTFVFRHPMSLSQGVMDLSTAAKNTSA
ncbi:MAG: hypothetical protein SGBAC_003973 [Bacillariaceae sp.]